MWMDASSCTPRMGTEKGVDVAEVKTKGRYVTTIVPLADVTTNAPFARA